jgi:anti-sigma regulatory factor (Ser/Thr protein kinase)
MDRRQFVATAAAATAPLAGCTRLSGTREDGRIDLTVRNDGTDPVTVQVAFTADDGSTYAEESDRIDGGFARSFAVVVGTSGRHVVTVSGDGFCGELA